MHANRQPLAELFAHMLAQRIARDAAPHADIFPRWACRVAEFQIERRAMRAACADGELARHRRGEADPVWMHPIRHAAAYVRAGMSHEISADGSATVRKALRKFVRTRIQKQ